MTTLSLSQQRIHDIECLRSHRNFDRLSLAEKQDMHQILTKHLLNVLYITTGLNDPDAYICTQHQHADHLTVNPDKRHPDAELDLDDPLDQRDWDC